MAPKYMAAMEPISLVTVNISYISSLHITLPTTLSHYNRTAQISRQWCKFEREFDTDGLVLQSTARDIPIQYTAEASEYEIRVLGLQTGMSVW